MVGKKRQRGASRQASLRRSKNAPPTPTPPNMKSEFSVELEMNVPTSSCEGEYETEFLDF